VVTELAGRLGLTVSQPNDPWNELVENDPSLAPLVQRIQQQEQELAELRNFSQSTAKDREEAAVRAEVNAVRAKYSDFDPQLVLPIAIENGVKLEAAYKIWKADKLAEEQANQVAARAAAEAAAARREKARKAKAKVSAGATKSRATSTDDYMKFDSFEDILNHELNR
jgi:septal ring factor EnvC (AmiA/AmiB activator)